MPNHWTRYAARTKKLEYAYTPKVIRIIKSFRKQFISNLTTHGEQYARQQLNHVIWSEELTPLIQSIYKTAGLLGARMLTDEQKKFIKEQKASGFGRNERWIRQVIDFLKLHMIGFVTDITDTMRNDIINVLQKAVDEGLGIPETVKLLQSEGLIKARATVIARTEINRAANTGHSIAAKELPYEVNKKWIAAHDHRTRQSHKMIDAHTTGENDFFNVPVFKGKVKIGTEQMLYPGDPQASAGNTVNCFLPDELTSVNPKIIKHAFRNWYSGEVVTIKTASGKKFTCTPNHPILTTEGWIKAGDLTDLHNLVKSRFIDTYALSEFNVQNSPSTFKQMFDALNVEWVSVRMPRAIVNFYGDIPASDVDIVSINGELRDRIQSASFQIPNKRFFKYSNLRKAFLFANGLLYRIFMMETFRKISNSIVSFSNQFLSFFKWSLSHAYVHGFTPVSRFNSLFPESSINNISTNSISFSELLHAYSTFVVSDDLVNRNIFADSPHLNPSFFESLKHCSGANADNIGYFLNRFSGIVESESVLKVESKIFNGHVYTFETVNQMYDINGYVARNCRCRVIFEPLRDSDGRLIMRNPNQATIIPMRQIPRLTPQEIAAQLKSHVSISVK